MQKCPPRRARRHKRKRMRLIPSARAGWMRNAHRYAIRNCRRKMKRYQLAIDREIDRSRSRTHARESEQLRLRQPPLCIEHLSSPFSLSLSLSLSLLFSLTLLLRYHSTQRSALAGKSAAAIKETTRDRRKEKAQPRYLLSDGGDESKASRFLLALIALLVLLFP